MKPVIIIILTIFLLPIFASCQEKLKKDSSKKSQVSYDRFISPKKDIELIKLEFSSNQKKYLISDKKKLKIIHNRLSDPKAQHFDTSIGRNREYVNYKFLFSDGFTDEGEAVLHLFKDRVVIEICFETDEGWMGGGPSLCFRLDGILIEKELSIFSKDFLSKGKNLKSWKVAKKAQEDRVKSQEMNSDKEEVQ